MESIFDMFFDDLYQKMRKSSEQEDACDIYTMHIIKLQKLRNKIDRLSIKNEVKEMNDLSKDAGDLMDQKKAEDIRQRVVDRFELFEGIFENILRRNKKFIHFNRELRNYFHHKKFWILIDHIEDSTKEFQSSVEILEEKVADWRNNIGMLNRYSMHPTFNYVDRYTFSCTKIEKQQKEYHKLRKRWKKIKGRRKLQLYGWDIYNRSARGLKPEMFRR